ncbi:MAG: hypothetical protein DMD80_13955 [Candidatus Rokuibacteriota bacterium]|nr:MAG: hypothetical protein DMD80_13955 [Candidatus Rokubacteria bacterium]
MGLVGQLKGRMGDPGSLLGIVPLLLESKFSIAGVGNLADTTDDTLFSTTIKAKTLPKDGDRLVVSAWGVFAVNGNNKRVTMQFGATTLVSSGVVVLNGKAWWLIAEIVRSGAATQLGIGEYTADTATAEVMTKTAPAENLAADIVLKVTGASPTTGAANDVLAHGYSILGLKN